jgi:hypothetical protein
MKVKTIRHLAPALALLATLAAAAGTFSCGSSEDQGSPSGGAGSDASASGGSAAAPDGGSSGEGGSAGGTAGSTSLCSGPLTCAPTSSSTLAVPPTEDPLGISYADWGERWYAWWASLPASTHPSLGGPCEQGQDDPDVWFLATAAPTCSERSCKVPQGRHILVMVDGFYGSPAPEEGCATNGECRKAESDYQEACAINGPVGSGDEVCLEVNGERVANLDEYAFTTGLFRIKPHATDPISSFLSPYGEHTCTGDCAKGSDRHMIACGYWVMLKPLEPGEHVLRFYFGIPDDGGFVSREVYYHLTVE